MSASLRHFGFQPLISVIGEQSNCLLLGCPISYSKLKRDVWPYTTAVELVNANTFHFTSQACAGVMGTLEYADEIKEEPKRVMNGSLQQNCYKIGKRYDMIKIGANLAVTTFKLRSNLFYCWFVTECKKATQILMSLLSAINSQ